MAIDLQNRRIWGHRCYFQAFAFVTSVSLFVLLQGCTVAGPGASSGPGEEEPGIEGGFPRLGMWWPDPDSQSDADIARYDLVMMSYYEAWSIESLRAVNPDVKLLVATNACEIDSTPLDELDSADRQWMEQVAPEWILTQVGTTLVSDVDATTTQFVVENLTVSNGEDEIDLFETDEEAVVGSEVVLVQDVDTETNTLTVVRGHARPATLHEAGTRIAATIDFWPGSWMMNVSTMCPLVTVDPDVGPERWTDLNVRRAAWLFGTGDWDGMIIDRNDPDESWLIGNSNARTIDPDRSNTLLHDYREFDEAWNDGLRSLHAGVRSAIGNESLLLCNLGLDDYSPFNGSIFEGFPRRPGGDTGFSDSLVWHKTVFGPHLTPNKGSYADWMEYSRSPQMSVIETYEIDEDSDSWGGGANPCGGAGFEPDYQHMRFGLTTALMNDGLFSYGCSTDGHGALGLWWFDEYDNAGTQRGYLGQPVGDPVQVVPELTTPVLTGDGSFAGSTGRWTLETGDGYAATMELDSGSLMVDVTQAGGETEVAVAMTELENVIEADTNYVLSFRVKAETVQEGYAWLQSEEEPWTEIGEIGAFLVSDAWRAYEIPFTATGGADAAGCYLGVGSQEGAIWFDDIRLQQGDGREVWQREFEGGIVIVNATAQERTVSLDGTYEKIDGTQDRSVNDGSLVNEVTVPAFDGIILLCP